MKQIKTSQKKRSRLGMVASLLVTGMIVATCATPTPYQPGDGTGGYTEKLLEQNRYRVSFRGNSLTSRETVETYLLFRAAELTVETGNDYFIMVERDTDSDTRYRTTYSDPWPYYGYYYSSLRYRYPYYLGGYGRYGDSYTQQVTRYTAAADVVVYSGAKPQDNPNAYDARDIMKNLGPDVIRPEDLAS